MSLKQMMKDMTSMPGKIAFYYKNLVTGEATAYQASMKLQAASTIKLFIMGEAFRQASEGRLSMDAMVTVRRADCVPSCGALSYMHENAEVTVGDLVTLMIILSDNTATNLLIDLLGMENINAFIRSLGFETSLLQRKMFDAEASSRGIQNYITAGELGKYLEMIYRGQVVNRTACDDMLTILSNQRLNHKMPFLFSSIPDAPKIAHKTGEDTGVTHDVGIVYAPEPFVVCYDANETDTALFNRFMADMTVELWHLAGGGN